MGRVICGARRRLSLIVLVLLLLTAACGRSVQGAGVSPTVLNDVSLNQTAVVFTPTVLFLGPGYFKTRGTPVIFFDLKGKDPTGSDFSGGTHTICLGQNGQCYLTASGPSVLRNGGLTFVSEQSVTVFFAAPGVYLITSRGEPEANLSITVQAPAPNSTL